MLKALVNEARLRLDITTQGPLLVKTGYATVIGADMAPVMTYRNGRQEIYIPGSSLKGVFRSHIEKVVNSIRPRVACNPLADREDPRDGARLYRPSCRSRFSKDMPSHAVYAASCPTCRLFGSTSYIGRIAIGDAYLPANTYEEKKFIEHRDGIAIDRLTGGVSGNAKFDLEVVTEGTVFSTDIHLRNFEIWQLGMLFVVLQDMQDELMRIGSGRSRGLGKIKASIYGQDASSQQGGLLLSTTRAYNDNKRKEPGKELWGLGRWLAAEGEEEKTYRTRSDDLLTLPREMAHKPAGIREVRVFKGNDLDTLKEQSIEFFVAQIQQWPSASQVPSVERG